MKNNEGGKCSYIGLTSIFVLRRPPIKRTKHVAWALSDKPWCAEWMLPVPLVRWRENILWPCPVVWPIRRRQPKAPTRLRSSRYGTRFGIRSICPPRCNSSWPPGKATPEWTLWHRPYWPRSPCCPHTIPQTICCRKSCRTRNDTSSNRSVDQSTNIRWFQGRV